MLGNERTPLGRELRENVSEGDGTSGKPVASKTLKDMCHFDSGP